jgi:hypothetical protein
VQEEEVKTGQRVEKTQKSVYGLHSIAIVTLIGFKKTYGIVKRPKEEFT